MEIVVYAANGLLKLMSENPLLIEIEEGHSNSISHCSYSANARRAPKRISGIEMGEKGAPNTASTQTTTKSSSQVL